jgi:hypothetical protein
LAGKDSGALRKQRAFFVNGLKSFVAGATFLP